MTPGLRQSGLEANGETHRVDNSGCGSGDEPAAGRVRQQFLKRPGGERIKPKLRRDVGGRLEHGERLGQLVPRLHGHRHRRHQRQVVQPSAWQGMQQAAAANPNVTVKYLQSTTQSDYVPNINTFLGEKCGIIVTVGFLMGAGHADARRRRTRASTSRSWTTPTPPVIKNIDALVFNTVQDGFLGGYLAAGMTKTGKVATFGGAEFPTVTIYMDGFWDGVQYYNQQAPHERPGARLERARPRRASSPVTSPTRRRARRSPRRSSARARTSSSRSPATSASAPPRRSSRRTPRAATSTCCGSTPTAASAPRSTASTSSAA